MLAIVCVFARSFVCFKWKVVWLDSGQMQTSLSAGGFYLHVVLAAWVSLASVVQSRAKHFQIAAKTWGVGVADWSTKKG